MECGLSCDVLSLCVGVGDNFTVAWEEDQISSLSKEERTEEVRGVIYCSDSCGIGGPGQMLKVGPIIYIVLGGGGGGGLGVYLQGILRFYML